jgi:hypothetical protein
MSTKHLLALLNSHIEGDEEQFLSIALQVAAQVARQGRSEDADKLKRLVQKARDQQRSGRPSSAEPRFCLPAHVVSCRVWLRAPILRSRSQAWLCRMQCAAV